MNQAYTYMILMLGLMLGFWIFGIGTSATLSGQILNLMVQNPTTVLTGWFYVYLAGVVAVGAFVGTVLGIFVKNIEWAIMAPIGALLGILFADFIQVFIIIYNQFNWVIALVVFIPPLVLWSLTIVEFIRGRD